MSLGLRREKLGDLLVTEAGCVLFVEREVVEYIMQNELRVKHVPLSITELSLDTFELPVQNTKELHIMVASMRLDTILAHGLNLSRSKAMDLIQAGKVKVNHSEVTDNDFICRQEDLISCRGFGRLRVGEQSGETKKGKLKVCLIKYL